MADAFVRVHVHDSDEDDHDSSNSRDRSCSVSAASSASPSSRATPEHGACTDHDDHDDDVLGYKETFSLSPEEQEHVQVEATTAWFRTLVAVLNAPETVNGKRVRALLKLGPFKEMYLRVLGEKLPNAMDRLTVDGAPKLVFGDDDEQGDGAVCRVATRRVEAPENEYYLQLIVEPYRDGPILLKHGRGSRLGADTVSYTQKEVEAMRRVSVHDMLREQQGVDLVIDDGFFQAGSTYSRSDGTAYVETTTREAKEQLSGSLMKENAVAWLNSGLPCTYVVSGVRDDAIVCGMNIPGVTVHKQERNPTGAKEKMVQFLTDVVRKGTSRLLPPMQGPVVAHARRVSAAVALSPPAVNDSSDDESDDDSEDEQKQEGSDSDGGGSDDGSGAPPGSEQDATPQNSTVVFSSVNEAAMEDLLAQLQGKYFKTMDSVYVAQETDFDAAIEVLECEAAKNSSKKGKKKQKKYEVPVLDLFSSEKKDVRSTEVLAKWVIEFEFARGDARTRYFGGDFKSLSASFAEPSDPSEAAEVEVLQCAGVALWLRSRRVTDLRMCEVMFLDRMRDDDSRLLVAVLGSYHPSDVHQDLSYWLGVHDLPLGQSLDDVRKVFVRNEEVFVVLAVAEDSVEQAVGGVRELHEAAVRVGAKLHVLVLLSPLLLFKPSKGKKDKKVDLHMLRALCRGTPEDKNWPEVGAVLGGGKAPTATSQRLPEHARSSMPPSASRAPGGGGSMTERVPHREVLESQAAAGDEDDVTMRALAWVSREEGESHSHVPDWLLSFVACPEFDLDWAAKLGVDVSAVPATILNTAAAKSVVKSVKLALRRTELGMVGEDVVVVKELFATGLTSTLCVAATELAQQLADMDTGVHWLKVAPDCSCEGRCDGSCARLIQLFGEDKDAVVFVDGHASSAGNVTSWIKRVKRSGIVPRNKRLVFVLGYSSPWKLPRGTSAAVWINSALPTADLALFCGILDALMGGERVHKAPGVDERLHPMSLEVCRQQRRRVLEEAMDVAKTSPHGSPDQHMAVFLMAATHLQHVSPRRCVERLAELSSAKDSDQKLVHAVAFLSAFAVRPAHRFVELSVVQGMDCELLREINAVLLQSGDKVAMHPLWARMIVSGACGSGLFEFSHERRRPWTPRPHLAGSAIQALGELAKSVNSTIDFLDLVPGAEQVRRGLMLERVDGQFSLLLVFLVHCSPDVAREDFAAACEAMLELFPSGDGDEQRNHADILRSRVYRVRQFKVHHSEREYYGRKAIDYAESVFKAFEDTNNDFLSRNNLAHALLQSPAVERSSEAIGHFECLAEAEKEKRGTPHAKRFYWSTFHALKKHGDQQSAKKWEKKWKKLLFKGHRQHRRRTEQDERPAPDAFYAMCGLAPGSLRRAVSYNDDETDP